MNIYNPRDKIQISILQFKIPAISNRNIKLYFESDEKKNTEIPDLFSAHFQHFIVPKIVIPRIDSYNQEKGIALEESESNEHYMTQVLRKYFAKNEYPKDKNELEKSDYMNKRNIFSEFLIKKAEMFYDIKELSSKSLRNDYTSMFYKYILDRNIFAHGILVYDVKKNIFYIEYKDPETKKNAYAILADDTFEDFETRGTYLRNVMIEMDKRLK